MKCNWQFQLKRGSMMKQIIFIAVCICIYIISCIECSAELKVWAVNPLIKVLNDDLMPEKPGNKIVMDAAESVGGKNRGPRPKPLTLASLGGCTGMDVVSILNKMRVAFEQFYISIEAEQTDEHPKYYKKIHIVYSFKGKNLPMGKLEKAVNLSQEKYCGVTEMLRKAAELSYEIKVEE